MNLTGENLKVAWDKNLLVQPSFFEDAVLTQFLNGRAVRWQMPSSSRQAESERKTARILFDATAFRGIAATVQRSRKFREALREGDGDFPAHYHEIGVIQLTTGAIPTFTWGVVRAVFGDNARKRDPTYPSPHAEFAPAADKVFMEYTYSGDDPTRYGYAELPVARFLLKRRPMSAPSDRSNENPRDTDTVESVTIYESTNRR